MTYRVFFLTLLVICVLAKDSDDNIKVAYLQTPEYLAFYSYPVETHEVVTTDGYVLNVYRTQAKNTQIVNDNRPVILLWHGLMDSSDTWLTNVESKAPGLRLANLGYDVWLANSRGNRYSLKHTNLDSTKDESYWEFTWQHTAEYDVPAVFGYIADQTKQKINYIGHSQGTMQMFGALMDPIKKPMGHYKNITDNLRKFAALGPIAYVDHIESTLLKDLAGFAPLIKYVQKFAKFGFLLPGFISARLGYYVCAYIPYICEASLYFVADVHTSVDNMLRFPVWIAHYPAGTSYLNLVHFDQAVENGKFAKFDYGTTQLNMLMYGQEIPPMYDPSLLEEEVAFFVGDRDELADKHDATNLYINITNAKHKEIHYYEAGHLTFLLGKELDYWEDMMNFLDLPDTTILTTA